jgi:hypothetical protein
MAKPADFTPAQEEALKKKLNTQDLSSFYDGLSEEAFRRFAGMPPAAVPVVGSVPPPNPITPPTPIRVKPTEADARRASGFGSQIQPESGMLPRFSPTAASSGQEQLDKALEQRRIDIAERSFTGPTETRLSAAQAAKELFRGQRLADIPRTPSGELRPNFLSPELITGLVGDNVVSKTYEAIYPKVIETAEQNRERDRQAYQATLSFVNALYPDKNNPPTKEVVKKVYNSYRYYGGKDPEKFVDKLMKRSGLDVAARAAFTRKEDTGQVIESGLTTAGKVLSASEAAATGLAATGGRVIGSVIDRQKSGAIRKQLSGGSIPSNFTDEQREEAKPEVSLTKEFTEEVSKGTGLMGAGSENLPILGSMFGADKDTQELLGYIGGTAGFFGGLLIPLDLGVVQGLSTAGKTASTTAKIAGEFGTGAVSAAGRGAIGGLTEGTIDAWRLGGARTGGLKTVTKEMETATRAWLDSPTVRNVTSTTIKLAADDVIQAAIIADREAGKLAVETKSAYDQQPYLDALKQRFNDIKAAEIAAGSKHPIINYNTFEDWVGAAEAKGIDVLNSAGKRTEVLGNPPPNIRIKEVEDSVKTTSAKRSSVDYFDEVSTGGRSNLYYDAFINSIDPAIRYKLIAGGSVKSEEFLAAVDNYVNDIRLKGQQVGKTAAQIDAEIGSLETILKSRGIKLEPNRIGGATKALTPTIKGGLISTPKIEKALEKAYAIDLGRRTLNDFASRTGITGQTVKVGNTILSPTEATEVRDAVKSNPTLKALKERLEKNNGNPVSVSREELKALKEYFIIPFTKDAAATGRLKNISPLPPSLFIKPTETYSPFQAAPAIRRIEASVGGPAPKNYIVSADQYNDLVKAALSLEASPKITAKSTQQISNIASTLSAAGDKGAELSYFVRNVLTPKDLQESGLAAILIDTSRKVINPPPTKNPVANKIIEEVNARMGSLGDRFKAKMRRKMNINNTGGPNTSRPEAFADTMVEEFTQEGIYKPQASTQISKPFEQAPAGAPLTETDRLFKQKMGAYEMYRSYVASIYGGYEQAIDAVATTGRTLEMDKMAIATKEMRDLVTVLMHAEGTIFNDYFVAFRIAVKDGNNIGALNLLQKLHIELSGYSIQQSLTRLSNVPEEDIGQLLENATTRANNGKVHSGAGLISGAEVNYIGNNISFDSGKGSRGIDEAYKAASQQPPLFKPENFKEMLIGNYYLRAQANVVDDVLFKAQVDFPELFPNSSLLLQIAEGDWATVRSSLIKSLDEKFAAGDFTPEQAALYPKLRKDIIRTGEPRIPVFTTPAVVNTQTAKLSQDLLISAIEDNVAVVSGGGGKSRRYLKTLTENFTEGLNVADTADIRKLLDTGLNELQSPPASLYRSIFDSQARADATALFYQTSLTNIKNQLKSPFSASVQGVAEKVGTIPLLQQAQASLKKPLFNAVNIKKATETIQGLQLSSASAKLDQYVGKDGIKIADEISEAERLIGNIIDDELSPEFMALAKRKEAVLNDLEKQSGDVLSRRLITDVIGTIYDGTSNIAKNGLLGGLVLPNFNYAVVNALTGPLIIAQTVGVRNAASVFSNDVIDVMRYAYSFNVGAGKHTWKAPANRVILTTPDGTIYTTEMLAKLVNEGALGKSQGAAELSNSLLGSSIDWAGRTGLYGDKNSVIKAARRNFFNYQDLNVWSTAANAVDQTYRMGVLVKALKEGEALEGATKLSRESLFDYGNLTDVEESIAKVVWFYRFKRNNFRSVFTSLATDPKALKLAFSQGQGWEYIYNFGEKVLGEDKNDVDMRYAMKEYSEARAFIDLVEDPENKKRYGIYGPPIPAIQAVAEMTDYASIFLTPYVMAATTDKGVVAATGEAGYGAFQIAVENANPMLQTAVLAGTGMDIRRGGQTASDYLDPKLIWYMQQNPEQWYTFTTLFNIEEVPFEEEKPAVGYYNGRQWRIKQKDRTAAKNWQVWQSGLLMIGVGRTMRDYAPILSKFGGERGERVATVIVAPITTLQKPKLPRAPEGKVSLPVTLETDGWGTDFWRAAGVIQVQDAPLLEEVQRANRLKAAGEIRSKPVKTQQIDQ